MELLRAEMQPPDADRTEDAEIVLVGWGSTRGAITEAVDRLRAEGRRVGALHFTELWPLPPAELPSGVRAVTVEGNATGQLAGILRSELRWTIDGTIGRSDGLPITADFIVRNLQEKTP